MPNDGLPRGAPVAAHERIFTLDALRGFAVAGTEGFQLAFLELMADEPRIFRSGTWAEQTRHRAAAYLLVGWPWRLGFISWLVLAYFVLGMYLVRREVFLERGLGRQLPPRVARRKGWFSIFGWMDHDNELKETIP